MAEKRSRREFMASAVGASAVGVAAPMLTLPRLLNAAPLVADPGFKWEAPKRSSRVRMGIIGVGGRGTGLLRDALRTGLTEVVAICDLKEDRIERAKGYCEGMTPRGHKDYQDLLQEKDLDAVFIATPVDLHPPMALDAIAADKHVYCEKPLGVHASEASKVHRAASKSSKVFQVGFQWHYNARFKAAIEAVHSGMIGEVRFIRAQRLLGGDLPHLDWLIDKNRSGDIIVEQAVHEMNIFCWAMGRHPDLAMGMGGINHRRNDPPGRTIMDHYSVSFEFGPDVRVSYSHVTDCVGPASGMQIHIYGSKGAVDVGKGEIYLSDRSNPAPRAMGLSGRDTFNAIASFFAKVRTGEKPEADSEGAMIATQTAILGREAIYERRPVAWEDLV